MSHLIHAAELHLHGYARYVLVALLLGVVVICFKVAVTAWKDISKLDREQYNLRERMLQPLREKLGPRDAIAIRTLRLQLVKAGLRQDNAIERYTSIRLAGLGGATVFTLLLGLGGADAFRVLLFGGLSFWGAYAAPDIYVDRKATHRQTLINRALPTMTDLMVLCLDVGLSIEAAFERVTLEMKTMEPLMAEEASLMLSEMGAGLNFAQALKRMAERVGVDDLTTLSRLISQASLLGASVAQALREYSDASFQKRLLSLEEQAGKISSMLTIPITACLLPAALIALIGPSIILLVKAFSHV